MTGGFPRAVGAFNTLGLVSQRSNRKLRDVAADLTATGELPALSTTGTRRSTG